MDAVIRNVFHQRRVHSLLFLHATHSVEHLTHSNNLEVTAIARDVGFLKGECIHQHCLDFIIFHGVYII
ncbi:Uncharacterised protein [Enterobacter cloacae]|nr:Uncharacterised protein [Enterobacter cloacae]